MSFFHSNIQFYYGLAGQCDTLEPDLAWKHERMNTGAVNFLLATFFCPAKTT